MVFSLNFLNNLPTPNDYKLWLNLIKIIFREHKIKIRNKTVVYPDLNYCSDDNCVIVTGINKKKTYFVLCMNRKWDTFDIIVDDDH